MRKILVESSWQETNKTAKSFHGQNTTVDYDFPEEYLTGANVTINDFISKLDITLTDAEKVCAVYHYIINKFSYVESEALSERNLMKGLNRNPLVCQAYASLACKMLNELGIMNLLLVGNDPSGVHLLNMVQLNSKWYHLDAICNDTPRVDFEYFLVSDEILGVTHNLDIARYPVVYFV